MFFVATSRWYFTALRYIFNDVNNFNRDWFLSVNSQALKSSLKSEELLCRNYNLQRKTITKQYKKTSQLTWTLRSTLKSAMLRAVVQNVEVETRQLLWLCNCACPPRPPPPVRHGDIIAHVGLHTLIRGPLPIESFTDALRLQTFSTMRRIIVLSTVSQKHPQCF